MSGPLLALLVFLAILAIAALALWTDDDHEDARRRNQARRIR